MSFINAPPCAVMAFALVVMAAGHTPSAMALSSTIDWPCGGEFHGEDGTFASPNYPENYPSDQRCTWTITSPDYTVIRVSFESFNLYNDNHDYLQIRDGNTIEAPQIAKCYSSSCADVVSTGNTLFLYFYSNYDGGESTGFKLNWIAALSSPLDFYSCDNSPDSGNDFDPLCGQDNYQGHFSHGYYSAYTNVHYDGTHRVERGLTYGHLEEEGTCFNTGYSITCYCNQDLCNNDLCQNCTIITPSPTTTVTQPAFTTTQPPNTSTQPPVTNITQPASTTTQSPIISTQSSVTTTQSPTTNQPPTTEINLHCYSCIDCSSINEDTDVKSSEEFLTCFTAIALGNDNFVVRGGSPDFFEDGICRHEADGVIICYCTSNICNNAAAASETELRGE